jgi:hypothetical protein
MTVDHVIIGDGGGVCVVKVTSAAAADYFDMDTILEHDVSVVMAIGLEDKAGTEAVTPCIITLSSTTPDRVTLGGSGSAVTYSVLVFYQSRKSTGGAA